MLTLVKEGEKAEETEKLVCPRCGRHGTLHVKTIRGYTYYYFVHSARDQCYLGPTDRYRHAGRTHRFPLKGLAYKDREEEYLIHLVDIMAGWLGGEDARKAERAFRALKTAAHSIINALQEIVEAEDVDPIAKARARELLEDIARQINKRVTPVGVET